MDACGQPNVLSDPMHAGQAFLFTGLRTCHFGPRSTAMDHIMWGVGTETGSSILDQTHNRIAKMSGGEVALVQSAQLERLRCRHQQPTQYLWEVAWVGLPNKLSAANVRFVNLNQSIVAEPSTTRYKASLAVYFGCLEPAMAAHTVWNDVLTFLQAALAFDEPPQCIVITSSSVRAFMETCESIKGWQQAGLWGLSRALWNEYPHSELSLKCVDMDDRHKMHDTVAAICSETENELLQRGSHWYGRRLVTSSLDLAANCISSTAPALSYGKAEQASTAANSMTEFTEMLSIDLNWLDACINGQEMLARQFLWNAMSQMKFEHIKHEHHRKLWKRWHARLQANPPTGDKSYDKLVAQFPEVHKALTILMR